MNELGQRIRELRRQKGWTLKELAERCSLSASFLSQLERGLSSSSIASLHTICGSLGMSLGTFFEAIPSSLRALPGEGAERTEVIEANQVPVINLSDAAIRYRFLSRDFPGSKFEIMIGEIGPGYCYPPVPHEGEEFGFVLEGRLRLTIGDKVHSLGAGDSYHFAASTPHGYEVEGEAPARVLWVGTVKYFQARNAIPAG
jgi:transcriptional regulator with XRE-family HTH domain